MFGCIVKIILENNFQCLVIFWKCYFPTNFSHFLNHFLNFQTNFISQNPPPHNTETTKTPPPTPLPKYKIRDQRDQVDRRESRSAREWLARKQIGERVIGDDQTRFKREREIKKERDRWRELRTWRRELDGAILPLRLGLGHCSLSLLSLLSLSLSLSLYRSTAFVSPSFSLSFALCMSVSSSLCASMSSGSDLKVK